MDKYETPTLEMGLFPLVMSGMELVLSAWMARRQREQSMIEQMRSPE